MPLVRGRFSELIFTTPLEIVSPRVKVGLMRVLLPVPVPKGMVTVM